MNKNQRFLNFSKKQNGSAIIIAIFVVILVGLLGASLAKLNDDSLEESLYEIYGTRANFAAYSANEIAIMQLNSSDQKACNSIKLIPSILNKTDGFSSCNIEVKCEQLKNTTSHLYKITSKANCGNRDVFAERQLTKKLSY